MKKFQDEKGWIRAAVCCVILLMQYGLRDSLLTALPTIASDGEYIPPGEDTTVAYSSSTTDVTFESTTSALPTVSQSSSTTDVTFESTTSAPPSAASDVEYIPPGEDTTVAQSSSTTDVTTEGKASNSPYNNTKLNFNINNHRTKINNINEKTNLFKSVSNDYFNKYSNEVIYYSDDIPPSIFFRKLSEVNKQLHVNNETGKYEIVHQQNQGKNSNFNNNGFSIPSSNPTFISGNNPTRNSVISTNNIRIPGSANDVPIHSSIFPNSDPYAPIDDLSGSSDSSDAFISVSNAESRDGNLLEYMLSYLVTKNDSDSSTEKQEKNNYLIVEDLTYEVYVENYTLGILKDDWTIMREGVVLSSVYWGWLITAILSDLIVNKLGVSLVMTISVSIGGLLGILMHAFSLGGPWVLLPFRIVLGAAQGLCLPAIIRLIRGIPESSRMVAASFVLLGSTIGSCIGVGLGSLEKWYISTYVLGSLAVPLIPLCLKMPASEETKKDQVSLLQILKTGGGFWSCIAVYVTNIFVLHTTMIGIPFCVAYTTLNQPSWSGVALLSVVLLVGMITRVATVLSPVLAGKGPISVLNMRRISVILGSLLMVIGLIVMGTAGLRKLGVLVGLAVGGVGLGVSLTRINCRLNFEELAPWTLPRLLYIVDIAGIFTAIWPPLIVAALAEADENHWVAVWMIPLALIIPSAVAYIILVTTDAQSWDERPDAAKANGVAGAGVEGAAHGPAPRGHRMSFKSAKSGLSFKSLQSSQTFKTAMSRRRSRTLSCRTIDEDLSVDMRSVIEDGKEDDLRSIAESNAECKSISSTISFKSDGADMHSIDLNAPDGNGQTASSGVFNGQSDSTDRTSAWLSYHHHVSVEGSAQVQPPTKSQIIKRNAIYELFW